MMVDIRDKWRPRHALFAALALIVVTNAVALFGVWDNRSGEPESLLIMSQRELWPNTWWRFKGENSATTLRLRWRIPHYAEEHDRNSVYRRSYANSGGVAVWCDREKLEALGFELDDEDGERLPSYYYSRLSREAYLVLEFDGEAYQRELEHARQVVKREESASSIDEHKRSEQESRIKTARKTLEDEENSNSRLFVIDAGLDVESLRSQYPDRGRYAIVRGEVKPRLVGSGKEKKVMGFVSDIANDRVNVPYHLRQLFEPMYGEGRRVQSSKVTAYEVELAFGQQLEPWISGVRGDIVGR
jgi:hypothetical protein